MSSISPKESWVWTPSNAALLFSSSPMGIALFGESGVIVEANPAYEALLDMSVEQMRDSNFRWTDLSPPASRILDDCAWEELRKSGYAAAWEKEYVLPGGKRIAVKVTLHALPEAVGEATYAGFFLNVSHAAESEKQLDLARRELSRERRRLERRNRDTGLLNEFALRLRKCRTEAEICTTTQQLIEQLLPETSGALALAGVQQDAFEVRAHWGADPPSRSRYMRDECNATKLGYLHRIENSEQDPMCSHHRLPAVGKYLCIPIEIRGEVLGALHVVKKTMATLETMDISEGQVRWIEQMALSIASFLSGSLSNVSFTERVQLQSVRDPMTGLFNRRYIEESIERELRRSERTGKPISLLLIDVDSLDNINRDFGTDAGDAFLKSFAAQLEKHIRAADTAARYDGDEFLLLMPDMPLEQAVARAEKFRADLLANPISFQGKQFANNTLTIGISCTDPGKMSSAHAFIEAADIALQSGKCNGGNQVVAREM